MAIRFQRPQIRLATLLLAMVPLGLLFLGARHWWLNRPLPWQPYSKALVQQELDEGRIVVVHFTAQWSMTTVYNLHLFDTSAPLRRYANSHWTTFVLADWTEQDNSLTDDMRELGFRSVPATVIYDSDQRERPQILLDIVTPEQLLQNLQALEQNRSSSHGSTIMKSGS